MLLNLFHKRRSILSRIRGFIYNLFFLNGWSKNLMIDRGARIWGNVTISDGSLIGKNCTIYLNAQIGENVRIGESVEMRGTKETIIKVKNNTTVNRGTIIIGNVTIGNNCLIAPYCVISGSNHVFNDVEKPINEQGLSVQGIIIEENVWIGAKVVIVDGVRIGKNAIIGAGSVVTKPIPENSIAVGNPCKVIKSR